MHLSIWDQSFCQRMSTMTSEHVLYLEDDRRQEDRSRLSCLDVTNGHSGLTGGQSDADLLPCSGTPGSTSPKYRRHGSRLGGVKVRHKRQALQDMARPLKHWLYKHRDNPYPTKTEKVLLALGSHMTLVQVSNWFANARRRLKNTVRQPDLSWALRIKLYNKYIQGNAERLSVSSEDTHSEDEAFPLQASVSQLDFGRSPPHIHHKHQGTGLTRADSAHSDDGVSPPSKYKSSLLNRYLNDTLRHVMAATGGGGDVATPRNRRSHSGSFSSNECDEDLVSPASSSETEANFVYHADTVDYTSANCDSDQPQDRGQQRRPDQEWREIHAAMALTNLAQGQSCATGPASATGRSCTRGPTTTTRTASMGKSCTAGGPTTATRQSCSVGPIITAASYTTGPTITSRIIQKSSHISEIKTVKVALANGV